MWGDDVECIMTNDKMRHGCTEDDTCSSLSP